MTINKNNNRVTKELLKEIKKAKIAKESHNFDFNFKCRTCGYYLEAKVDYVLSCDEVVIKDILE